MIKPIEPIKPIHTLKPPTLKPPVPILDGPEIFIPFVIEGIIQSIRFFLPYVSNLLKKGGSGGGEGGGLPDRETERLDVRVPTGGMDFEPFPNPEWDNPFADESYSALIMIAPYRNVSAWSLENLGRFAQNALPDSQTLRVLDEYQDWCRRVWQVDIHHDTDGKYYERVYGPDTDIYWHSEIPMTKHTFYWDMHQIFVIPTFTPLSYTMYEELEEDYGYNLVDLGCLFEAFEKVGTKFKEMRRSGGWNATPLIKVITSGLEDGFTTKFRKPGDGLGAEHDRKVLDTLTRKISDILFESVRDPMHEVRPIVYFYHNRIGYYAKGNKGKYEVKKDPFVFTRDRSLPIKLKSHDFVSDEMRNHPEWNDGWSSKLKAASVLRDKSAFGIKYGGMHDSIGGVVLDGGTTSKISRAAEKTTDTARRLIKRPRYKGGYYVSVYRDNLQEIHDREPEQQRGPEDCDIAIMFHPIAVNETIAIHDKIPATYPWWYPNAARSYFLYRREVEEKYRSPETGELMNVRRPVYGDSTSFGGSVRFRIPGEGLDPRNHMGGHLDRRGLGFPYYGARDIFIASYLRSFDESMVEGRYVITPSIRLSTLKYSVEKTINRLKLRWGSSARKAQLLLRNRRIRVNVFMWEVPDLANKQFGMSPQDGFAAWLFDEFLSNFLTLQEGYSVVIFDHNMNTRCSRQDREPVFEVARDLVEDDADLYPGSDPEDWERIDFAPLLNVMPYEAVGGFPAGRPYIAPDHTKATFPVAKPATAEDATYSTVLRVGEVELRRQNPEEAKEEEEPPAAFEEGKEEEEPPAARRGARPRHIDPPSAPLPDSRRDRDDSDREPPARGRR